MMVMSDFMRQFLRLKSGVAGVAILLFLIALSLYAAIAIPLESFKQWNNPNYWIKYPKAATPGWINFISSTLPSPQGQRYIFRDTIFSTESEIRDNLRNYLDKFSYDVDITRPQVMLLSAKDKQSVLKASSALNVTV